MVGTDSAHSDVNGQVSSSKKFDCVVHAGKRHAAYLTSQSYHAGSLLKNLEDVEVILLVPYSESRL